MHEMMMRVHNECIKNLRIAAQVEGYAHGAVSAQRLSLVACFKSLTSCFTVRRLSTEFNEYIVDITSSGASTNEHAELVHRERLTPQEVEMIQNAADVAARQVAEATAKGLAMTAAGAKKTEETDAGFAS